MPGWFGIVGIMEHLGISELDVYERNSPAILNRMAFILEQRQKVEERKARAQHHA